MRIALLLLLAAGCATDAMDDDDGSMVPGGGGGKADGPTTIAPSYALELVSTTTIQDDREAGPSELTLRARARVKTTVTGDQVALDVRLCDVTLPQVSGYQPELDAAFVASLPALKLAGTLDGTTLKTEPTALVLGAALADPIADELPVDASDPRVRDQDGDGNAGVSIKIPGYGSIFSTLRVNLAVDVALDRLRGTADVGLERTVFDDDIWFYDAKSSLADTDAHVTVLANDNRVKLRSGITTCGGVRNVFP